MPRGKKRTRSQGVGTVMGELRDLPVRSTAENEAERRACFDKAWARKKAREAAAAAPKAAAASKAPPPAKPKPKQVKEFSDSDSD